GDLCDGVRALAARALRRTGGAAHGGEASRFRGLRPPPGTAMGATGAAGCERAANATARRSWDRLRPIVSEGQRDAAGYGQFRTLGGLPALALVIGSMLGIGIFISPPEVAAHVSGPLPFMLIWVVGGLAALFGALSLAELGAILPRDGGDYTYLRESWGPRVAFAAGWLQLLAIFPGSLAAVAVATAKFQLPALFGPEFAEPLVLGSVSIPASHLWAAAIIIGLTCLNHV